MPAPVILSPNPANPHPNGLGLPLGGELLQWGPFQMTNYNLDMYGGAGTVEVIGPSSLLNSTLTLDGPNANLINDGTMRLQHSQLMINGSLAGTGAVVATQGSTITASSTVPVKDFYLPGGPKPDPTVTATSTYPSETITLRSSNLWISGLDEPFTAPITMDQGSTVIIGGIFEVAKGQNFSAHSIGAGLGTVIEGVHGALGIGGTMRVDAKLVQAGDTAIDVGNHGRLILSGPASSPDAQLSSSNPALALTAVFISGTLEFAQRPGFMHSPETASENFALNIGFDDGGAIQFDGVAGKLLINLDMNLRDLSVFNYGQRIADFHLGPSQNTYSATDFSVRGNELLYHHS